MASSTVHEQFSFQNGQMVWARVRGFPYWPAKVVEEKEVVGATKKLKKKAICVRFFGPESSTGICAIPDVQPYFLNRDRFPTVGKKPDFVEAVEMAEEYAQTHPHVKDFEKDILVQIDDDKEKIQKAVTVNKTEKKATIEKVEKKPSKSSLLSGNISTVRTRTSSSLEKSSPTVDSSKQQPEITVRRTSSRTNSFHDGKRNIAQAVVSSPVPKLNAKERNKELAMQATKLVKVEKRPAGAPLNGDGNNNNKDEVDNGYTSPKRQKLMPEAMTRQQRREEFQSKKIGLIGLGSIGSLVLKRLLEQNFHITVYDRSFERKVQTDMKEFAHVSMAQSPAALMEMCDILVSCVTDAEAAKDVLLARGFGALDRMDPSKAYIEFTTLDPRTSNEFYMHVRQKGGRYIEAPLIGSKSEAGDGQLLFMCSGDKSLFDECEPLFRALGRRAVWFGDAGNGAKFRMCHQLLTGIMISGVAEVAAMGIQCGASLGDLGDLFGTFGNIGSPLVKKTLKDISEGVFEPSQKLGQFQGEFQLALNYAGELCQPTLVSSAVNQLLLMAKRRGEGNSDISAVYRTLVKSPSSSSTVRNDDSSTSAASSSTASPTI